MWDGTDDDSAQSDQVKHKKRTGSVRWPCNHVYVSDRETEKRGKTDRQPDRRVSEMTTVSEWVSEMRNNKCQTKQIINNVLVFPVSFPIPK